MLVTLLGPLSSTPPRTLGFLGNLSLGQDLRALGVGTWGGETGRGSPRQQTNWAVPEGGRQRSRELSDTFLSKIWGTVGGAGSPAQGPSAIPAGKFGERFLLRLLRHLGQAGETGGEQLAGDKWAH